MFSKHQKAKLLRQVESRHDEIIQADVRFWDNTGEPLSPELIADNLERLFFTTKQGTKLVGAVTWELGTCLAYR